MMPKKGRRNIIIDKVLYHYTISGCISVVIQNTETDEIIKWDREWKPKWKSEMTPKGIRRIIHEYYGNH